jgi:hypothetical protein
VPPCVSSAPSECHGNMTGTEKSQKVKQLTISPDVCFLWARTAGASTLHTTQPGLCLSPLQCLWPMQYGRGELGVSSQKKKKYWLTYVASFVTTRSIKISHLAEKEWMRRRAEPIKWGYDEPHLLTDHL